MPADLSSRPPRVALATCRELPALDPDDAPLLGLLRERGVDAAPAAWDDPAVDWAGFDLVVLRSTWDYPANVAAFLAWIDRLPSVLNPAPALRWNVDKRYLAGLAALGLPVVPTVFVGPGEAFVPPSAPFVVKPSVGAGSKDAARYGPGQEDAARQHVGRLHRGGKTAMLQPYLERVDRDGEAGLVFLGGRFSHAIRKGPMLTGAGAMVGTLYVAEEISRRDATAREREVAERALDAVPGGAAGLLYARVDLVPGSGGEPLILEVEVTEPSLFLGRAPGSAELLADRIAAAARR